MKTRFELLTLAAVLTLTAAATQAGDLTIPNTFVSGTKALAEEVNANFTATQTAVNSKQNKITGACVVGSFVASVNADGTLVCDTPAGGGDVTGVTAGTGLSGGGASGDVSLAVDTAVVQQRLSAGCAAGSSIRDISATGVPTCEIDDNTTYTAGAGLTVSGTQFRLGLGYAYVICNATACTLQSNPSFSNNPSGQPITAVRNSIGNYTVTFAGMTSLNGGNVQVTAHAISDTVCNLSVYTVPEATVRCYSANSGALIDSRFSILMIP